MGKNIADSIQEAGAESDDAEVKGYIQKALDAKNTDHMTFVGGNGPSCSKILFRCKKHDIVKQF